MNKLREKLKPSTQITRTGKLEDFSEQCEKISDDFAIKFAEWYIDNYHLNKTTIELLKIFKTNHYE